MSPPVKIVKENRIATLMLNRPEAFNALNLDLLDCLATHLVSLAADREIRGIVISGAGRAFCAGGDLKWAMAYPQGAPAALHELTARFHQGVLEIRRMSKPVIAAVNGVAAGGGFSLTLACDFRVMDESAVMQQAYTSAGLSIDGGGSFSLSRLVGPARAMEIMAFDRPISAEQALSWGLATHVAKAGEALSEAASLARELAQKSLSSFGWSKRLLLEAFDNSFEKQMQHERRGIVSCSAHPDGQEGMAAFSEKRKPRFVTD